MSKLREYREMLGYNQKELAQIAGIPANHIRKYESGERTLQKASWSILYRISIALCRPIETFMEESKEIKEEVIENMVPYLADIEMSDGSHCDYVEDYDSEKEFYLSVCSQDGYLTYLTDTYVDDEEDALWLQKRVCEYVEEKCNE